jgi:hypothetical protein
MTPESKAMQLMDRFKFDFGTNLHQQKQCAMMCVYEIMDTLIELNQDIKFWKEVRMHLIYYGTDEFEAKADKFNLNA